MKPRPRIHRTHIVRIHGTPGKAISLDEYIETERAGMTADRLRELSGFSARIFAKLATELGHPEWAADPRFVTNADRAGNKDVIIGLISDIMRKRPSSHWQERLDAIGIPCAPINDLSDLLGNPQVQALGMLTAPPGLDLPLMGLPLSFDGERPPVRHGAPSLGQDTAALRGQG